MGLLDDIKQRERDRAAERDAETRRFLADAKRRGELYRTKLARYEPLIEEFARESGWTIDRQESSGSSDDSAHVSLRGSGVYECRCAIIIQKVRIEGWIWDRHALCTDVSSILIGGRDQKRFDRRCRGINISWLRSVLRELYAQVKGVR